MSLKTIDESSRARSLSFKRSLEVYYDTVFRETFIFIGNTKARHREKNRSESAEKNGRLTITGNRNKSGLRVPHPFHDLPSGNLDCFYFRGRKKKADP